MALTNNPTPNEAVKEIKRLDTEKQDALVSGTNIKTINNQSILGSGDISAGGIEEISTQYIRITDLDAGVYKLTYAGTKYIYYSGTTSTSAHTVAGSTGTVVLTVNKYSTNYWHWYYINGTTGYETIYYGYTSTSIGALNSKALNSLLVNISSYVRNNLTYSTSTTSYALSAYQGYLLNQNKQDKLTAGNNITISNNVISASGGNAVLTIQQNGTTVGTFTPSGSDTTINIEADPLPTNVSAFTNDTGYITSASLPTVTWWGE